MIYFPLHNATLTYILFFVFGLTNSGVGLAYAVSTELPARAVIGTSIAFTNMASIFVGATLQPLVGQLIDTLACILGDCGKLIIVFVNGLSAII